MSTFEDVIDIAEKEAFELEPWSNYYRLRAKEMEALFSLYNIRASGRVLDIGSGIGFNSFILDRFYDETFAVDLYTRDPKAHSLGIKSTKDFIDRTTYKNIRILAARCEDLPFADNFFDTVFLIYALEHIKDRPKALTEINRVLKIGGEAVVIVPGFLERLFYPLSFYRDFLKRMLSYLKSNTNKNMDTANKNNNNNISDLKNKSFWERFFNAYPDFPFPNAHGEYASFFSELMRSISLIWFKLARQSRFKIKGIFTTILFPKEISTFFLGERALEFYIKTLWINKKYGKNIFLRHLGQNLCLVLEK